MEHRRGRRVGGGKTKTNYRVIGSPALLCARTNNKITAHDDPRYTREFATKAYCSVVVNGAIMRLLAQAGIPVAFREQLSDRDTLVEWCDMFPLEVIGRRQLVLDGSYVKRHPDLRLLPEAPRVPRLIVEMHLKTGHGGKFRTLDGRTINLHLNASKGQEDPLIMDPHADVWELHHAKLPLWHAESRFATNTRRPEVRRDQVVPDVAIIDEAEDLVRQVFYVLEMFFNLLGFRLQDIKIEVGISRVTGRLVVADVIDLDSLRIIDTLGRDHSKQTHRRGESAYHDRTEVSFRHRTRQGLSAA